jgi:hypothetical protein
MLDILGSIVIVLGFAADVLLADSSIRSNQWQHGLAAVSAGEKRVHMFILSVICYLPRSVWSILGLWVFDTEPHDGELPRGT